MARYLSRRAALVVLAFTQFFITASLVVPSPLYPMYQERFGFSSVGVTLVFSAYVMAMLVTLLISGTLSDSWGRKPVIMVAVGAAVVAMLLFLFANGFGMLIAARIFQGITFGLISGAAAAALVEMAKTPAIGALINVFSQTISLTFGTFVSGILVQFAPYPFQLMFVILLAIFVLAGILVLFTAESNDKRHLAKHSWKPRLAVPPVARKRFLQLVPGMVASMALNGFYLALGPSLVNALLNTSSPFAAGVLMSCITGPGVIAALFMRNVGIRWALTTAGSFMALGTLVTFVALLTSLIPLLYIGTAIAGVGWGSSAGAMSRALAVVTPQHQRGGVFSAMMVVSYLAFSVPVLVVGGFVNAFGILSVVPVYILVIFVIATLAAYWGSRIKDATPPPVTSAPASAAAATSAAEMPPAPVTPSTSTARTDESGSETVSVHDSSQARP